MAQAEAAVASVAFDSKAWKEDLLGSSPAGRDVAKAARTRLEKHGVRVDSLRTCLAQGPDGTRLPGCLKLYLPDGETVPKQDWGMVFLPQSDGSLLCLAFGLRHPPNNSPKLTVYQRADRRLNPPSAVRRLFSRR